MSFASGRPADSAAGAGNGAVRGRDTVVIGASAGGVEALGTLVAGLPSDFPAAVLVVLHLMQTSHSMLPQILSRHGTLPAEQASDGQRLLPGHVFVAPPSEHLLVRDGVMRLVRGPRENGHRPAIDPLFRSAARARGPRVIGVILSGLLDDGAAGLAAVKERGGACVVQDPSEAMFDSMPRAAIAATHVDAVARLAEIPRLLVELAAQPTLDTGTDADIDEPDLVEGDPGLSLVEGEPTPVTCPNCGGAMWETRQGDVLRFTCQVGHAYSAESMLAGHDAAVEAAMWAALRILEERAELLTRMAHRQHGKARSRFETRAAEAARHALMIRELLASEELEPAGEA